MSSSNVTIMKNKIISFISLMFALIYIFIVNINILYAADTRIVTGLDGEKIIISYYPKRIACFYHPAYDKIVMMSKVSRIALLPSKATPWAYKFYPELKGFPINSSGMVPDVERLLKLKVDLVFYPKGKINISKVADAGITIICPFNDKYIPSTMDEHTSEFKKQVHFFGEILGPDAAIRAANYCKYLDGITAKITAITSRILERDKPKVYYGKTINFYSTQGNNTIMRWYTELAGGVYLPKKLEKYFAEVNMERIIAWDPDIILLGMYESFDTVTDNSAFKKLRASKSGKVYKVPVGIFCWDMTSCETALLPLFLGKKFHPELFKDWDIISEMKKFYFDIYKINLTGKDAERIVNGMPPL